MKVSEASIGVDLGGTAIKAGRVEGGTPVERLEVPTPQEAGPCADAIAEAARRLALDGSLPHLGIGVPGVLDAEGRQVLDAPNLAFLEGFPLASTLEQELGCPVRLENDANVAALGEARSGAAQGIQDFLLVTLGTGVGGGLILDGKPYHGPGGMAGEVGHLLSGHDRECGCGNRGCLEAIASARAMETLAAQSLGRSLSLKELSQAARMENDADALAVFQTAGEALGQALAQVALLMDVRVFLFGGGGAPCLDLLAPHVLRVLESRAFGRKEKDFLLRAAGLGNDAGIVGAACL